MKEWKKYRIKDIAELFLLPISTLHYWEKEKLIQANRSDNQYRIYESRDFFDIWEVQLYRSLQVPVAGLKQLKQMDGHELEGLLEDKQCQLEKEIDEKMRILKRLKEYKQGFELWDSLVARDIKPGADMPDFAMLQKDPFSKETIRQNIEHPRDCCLLFRAEDKFRPIMCIPFEKEQGEKYSVLWKRQQGSGELYCMTGLCTEVNRMENNNIKEIREELNRIGYEVSCVTARYLFTACIDGVRYDHHQAWFSVYQKNNGHSL